MGDVYQLITDRIVELLERGTVPWNRPWGGPEHHPRNLATGKKYRGINVFLLTSSGHESPYWLTFRQAKEREGFVRKGERGTPCIYWNWIDRKDEETGGKVRYPFLKRYTVFNVQQCEDIEFPPVERRRKEFSPIETCEAVVSGMPNPPTIEHDRRKASYSPSQDRVEMPRRSSFESEEGFYATLFHELIHSTGHDRRLNRPEMTSHIVYGSRPYTREELVAEMGAAYLCGQTGIENAVIENSASYLAGWLGKIRGDNRLVVQAAGKAQKATDFILGRRLEGNEADA